MIAPAIELCRVCARDLRLSDEIVEGGLTYPIEILARESGLITVILEAEPKALLRRFSPAAELDVCR